MNFYELKTMLVLPRMAGVIRRKSDVFALLGLHKSELKRLQGVAYLIDLNRNERDSVYLLPAIEAIESLCALHERDIATLEKYLKEHRMIE